MHSSSVQSAHIQTRDPDAWHDHQTVMLALEDAIPRIRKLVTSRYPDKATWFQRGFGSWMDGYVAREFRLSRTDASQRAATVQQSRSSVARAEVMRVMKASSARQARAIRKANGRPIRQIGMLTR